MYAERIKRGRAVHGEGGGLSDKIWSKNGLEAVVFKSIKNYVLYKNLKYYIH